MKLPGRRPLCGSGSSERQTRTPRGAGGRPASPPLEGERLGRTARRASQRRCGPTSCSCFPGFPPGRCPARCPFPAPDSCLPLCSVRGRAAHHGVRMGGAVQGCAAPSSHVSFRKRRGWGRRPGPPPTREWSCTACGLSRRFPGARVRGSPHGSGGSPHGSGGYLEPRAVLLHPFVWLSSSHRGDGPRSGDTPPGGSRFGVL